MSFDCKIAHSHISTLQAVTHVSNWHMYHSQKANLTYYEILKFSKLQSCRQVITDTAVPFPSESDRKRSRYSPPKSPQLGLSTVELRSECYRGHSLHRWSKTLTTGLPWCGTLFRRHFWPSRVRPFAHFHTASSDTCIKLTHVSQPKSKFDLLWDFEIFKVAKLSASHYGHSGTIPEWIGP